MGALATAFVWYLWRQRKGDFVNGNKPFPKTISCPPMCPDKQTLAKENDYAFDNPYFKDDEVDGHKHDSAEKGVSGFRLDNDGVAPAQKAKQTSNGTTVQSKKNRPFSNLPFHSVFHPSGKKQRATMDDTYLSKHLERITVPLRGHDFTGLGFNICGNMRDGIFVKDVLHRGPASESGKVKAGDRIVGVTVSFDAVVYEDALTILSYASPYDVRLEIEKCSAATPHGGAPTASPKRLGASTSFRNGAEQKGRLFHPLYRSQSIDDLTQIGKDARLAGHSPGVHEKQPKETNPSATPKRSQSVEASNGGPKSRPGFSLKSGDESKSLSSGKGSRKSSVSSCDSAGKIATAVAPQPPAPAEEEAAIVKKEVKSSRFRVEQISVKSETRTAPPAKPVREVPTPEELKPAALEEAIEAQAEVEQPADDLSPPTASSADVPASPPAEEAEKPTAPPRRASTPAKRKAPAPPPAAPAPRSETAALVHREDEAARGAAPGPDAVPDLPPPPPTSAAPLSSDPSLAAAADSPSGSPGKRKASSLGDLTRLEQESGKMAAASSSAVLERAVSMDLQQSMPGENLVKQKKILRAPTFEDDENKESDVIDGEGGGILKRWDNGLNEVLGVSVDGHPVGEEHQEEGGPAISEQTETPSVIDDPPKQRKVITVDLVDSSSDSETYPDGPDKQLTSTPAKKNARDFMKDDDISLDDVPYMGSASARPDPAVGKKQQSSSGPFSPVTISIPVIKPDLKHFEKLPSPSAEGGGWRPSKTPSSSTTPEDGKSLLERISVQSLYRPIFGGSKDSSDEEASPVKLVNGNDTDTSAELDYSTAHETNNTTASSIDASMLSIPLTSNNNNSNDVSMATTHNDVSMSNNNGMSQTTPGNGAASASSNNNNNTSPMSANNSNNDISLSTSNNKSTVSSNSSEVSLITSSNVNDVSSSATSNNNASSTHSNNNAVLSNDVVSVTMEASNNRNNNSVAPKAPNNVAGFAKTLIVPGPNEVENLLSLAAEPITPPPQISKSPKSAGSE